MNLVPSASYLLSLITWALSRTFWLLFHSCNQANLLKQNSLLLLRFLLLLLLFLALFSFLAHRRLSYQKNFAAISYARGGTEITGSSIRLAEAIVQNWQNVQFGIRELEQWFGESTIEARTQYRILSLQTATQTKTAQHPGLTC